MFNTTFYNQTTRKYVAIFGTLFNNISITRSNNSGELVQTMKVPLSYAPAQKFLSRIQQDPGLDAPAILLPRMSFEIVNMNYDPERKLTSMAYNASTLNGVTSFQYSPTPYNIDFRLTIMAKYQEDGTKILEQILPHFMPAYTVTAKMIDTPETIVDIPVVLNGVSFEDTYEASYEERRLLTWTLDFVLKGYYYGPTSTDKKLIKFVDIRLHNDILPTAPISERITAQPGLTANGEPTTDITQTIPYSEINPDDDWAYIVQVEKYNE